MATYTQAIIETSYLSAQDAVHYRAIMRKMFIENEHMHYRLYKEDIFKLVKEDPDFEEYTIDELKQDLDQLVNWNNLIAVQDPGIVHTIAEYKNKQYRYSMSERAVEIERLTVRLENLNIESSSLSTNHFLRIDERFPRPSWMRFLICWIARKTTVTRSWSSPGSCRKFTPSKSCSRKSSPDGRCRSSSRRKDRFG